MFCIYLFSDEDFMPQYVGKTKHLKVRIKQHLNDRLKRKGKFYSWLNKTINEGKNYYVDILEECNEDNWKEREIYWIKHIKDCNYPLRNLTEGGDGGGDMLKGIIPKCIENNKKPILQYNLEGEFIKEFASVKEAANSVNSSTSCISKVAKNKGKYTKGYQWVYKTENYPLKIDKCDSKLQRIVQYDLEHNFIKLWNSASEIEKHYKLRKNKILDITETKRQILNGFIWKKI